ncbi:MAG TPA: hypothetical protein VIG88_13880 [Lysobacter sp.]
MQDLDVLIDDIAPGDADPFDAPTLASRLADAAGDFECLGAESAAEFGP